MAHNARELPVGTGAAFAALVDPETYPHWLVGAQSIRDIDADWPAPGSSFHHVVGLGPVRIPDHTDVVAIEPGSMLQLEVHARPFVKAIATFTLTGDDTRCVITLQEEPTRVGPGGIVRLALDPSIHLRNHRSLEQLAAYLGGQGDAQGSSR